MSDPQEPPSEPQPTPKIKRGKSKSRAHRQRKHRMESEPQQQDESHPTEPSPPQNTDDSQAIEPSKPSPPILQKAIEKSCRKVLSPKPEVHPPEPGNTANEADILATLSNHGYIITAHTTLSPTLCLIKKDTLHLEIFNTLIEQISVQLGNLKEELLKPSVGKYAWKEKVMLEMLTEVVSNIAELAREVGVEVTEALEVNWGGIRLFVGLRGEESEAEEIEWGAEVEVSDAGQNDEAEVVKDSREAGER